MRLIPNILAALTFLGLTAEVHDKISANFRETFMKFELDMKKIEMMISLELEDTED